MNILLNGNAADISTPTVFDLLKEQGLDPESRGIAIALNGEFLPRSEWGRQELNEGDALELITAMQGG